VSQRRPTATSNFGVSRRESHDASAFYERFAPPELSDDDTVPPPEPVPEPFVCGDARSMTTVPDGSVALVVTSPPYFAGKEYEDELEREGVPSSYLEYLALVRDVFAECARKLEPGGRIAVNVANLGRKPYRSLSADVIRILQDDLGLLLRGEIVWQKGQGASGSCAWGSFRSAANPVVRDVTERVIVASKGRFDRALPVRQREAKGLPHESTITADDFMACTLDVWRLPPERAGRVGHPAPFPVELPERLIDLFTFRGDLVLDPFMGSGSALVAAARKDRRYVGYDLDPAYVEVARRRVAEEGAAMEESEMRARTTRLGKPAAKLAEEALVDAGFRISARHHPVPRTGVRVDFAAVDGAGDTWYFDVAGPFSIHRGGLLTAETVWRCLGRAHVLRGQAAPTAPFVLLTTDLPRPRSEGDTALRSAGPGAFFDAVELLSEGGTQRLRLYAKGGYSGDPQPGFWTATDLAARNAQPFSKESPDRW
jgi:DNA modification methylase